MNVLLLHGLGADRRQPLDLFGPVLASLGAGRVIALDVRAHGDSTLLGGAEDFAIDRLAAEVAAELRATDGSGGPAGQPPLTVIGISMGAAIALRLALLDLLPVERAVFVRPSFDDRSMPPNLRVFPIIGQLLHDLGAGKGAERFRESDRYRAFEHQTPLGAKGLLSQFTQPRAAERAIRLVEVPRNRAFASEAELGDAARRIRSQVVAAPRDPVHPVETGERWAGALGAPLELLPARDDGQAAQTARLREVVGRWLGATG